MALVDGLVVWNNDGSIRVTVTTSIGHGATTVDTGKGNGSVTLTNPLGIPFIIAVLPLEAASYQTAPTVWVSGATLYWSFSNPGSNANGNCRILYGVR